MGPEGSGLQPEALPADRCRVTARCAGCGTRRTADVPWCTSCYARTPVAPAAAPVRTTPSGAPAPVPRRARPRDAAAPHGPADLDGPSWPCGSCSARVPLAASACPACGRGFLADGEEPVALRLPGVGDVASLSRAARLALGAGVALAVALLVQLVVVLVGQTVG